MKPIQACPNCKFGNLLNAMRCLFCKHDLSTSAEPASASAEPATTAAVSRGRVTTSTTDDPDETVFGRTRIIQAAEAKKLRASMPLIPADSDIALMDSSEVTAMGWLCGDGLVPLPLGVTPTLVIGRHPSCDLVLRHREVSRQHGEIRSESGSIVYRDLGSSNGTFINGERVDIRVLRAGDKIVLGPYELTIRSQAEMDGGQEPADSSTRIFRFIKNAAITGLIEEMPIAELLQGLEFNQKTGTLTVEAGDVRGRLVVRDGCPIFAFFGALADSEAVVEMVNLRRGTFAFTVGLAEVEEATMTGSLGALLMEASRRIDEESFDGDA